MGVGRYVTKNEWLTRWPEEASFLKIIGVKPKMDRWLQSGCVWAEWTLRGRKLGIYEFKANLNRSDWRLIHKHEEKQFLDNPKQMPPLEIPSTMPIPPLQKHMNREWIEKYNIKNIQPTTRTALDLCIDPQFEWVRPFIVRVEPSHMHDTIYDEADPKTYLELYGRMLPVKFDVWTSDPAKYENHFGPNK